MPKPRTVKISALTPVGNALRRFGSILSYFASWAMWKGKPTPMLFTEEQILDAIERAKKNKEDWMKKDFITNLIDRILP